ncbi:hypothetical protein [Nocardia thailandica]|uniref:hypothetical protein n=1 Tax=Nocardia thailandica TaxID=257275 RepID=UPI000317E7F8|nr:hypothetical protein [Nocardia thailandica]
MLLVILLGFAGCLAPVGTTVNQIDMEINWCVTVTCQVDGSSAGSSITYPGKNMDIAQDTDVTLLWTMDVPVEGFTKTVTLTTTAGADGEQVPCCILVGDKVIAELTANGPLDQRLLQWQHRRQLGEGLRTGQRLGPVRPGDHPARATTQGSDARRRPSRPSNLLPG